MGDQPTARPLTTYRTTQTWNKRTNTPVPQVGFGPTTQEFKHEKIIHVLDRAATVIGESTIQGASKRALQWYSKCYCAASITKNFTLEGV
jgi:hypothetical protein